MRSSILDRIRLRLSRSVRRLWLPPNYIDGAVRVGEGARITASALHGPVEVGERATVHQAEISGPVTIGRRTSLWGPGIHVLARVHAVTIGSFCSIARNVSVHGYDHDVRRVSTHYIGRNVLGLPIEEEVVSKGPTRIGHDVWIGAGVHVLAGTTIGNGAVVGAGSVVSRNVPPYAVAVGSPATVVRRRFDDETIARLEASRWWEWSDDEIRLRQAFFTNPVTPELLDEWL